MEELINAFRVKANKVETELGKVVEIIHNGFAPDMKHVAHIDELLMEVRCAYENIKNKAEESCSSIEGELSIEEYYNRYETEQAHLRTVQLEKAREMLRQFLDVQATDPAYLKAIQKQKNDASDKLDSSCDEIPDTTAEGLFLHALALDSIPEEVNEQLDEFFSGKVTRGLANNVYFLPAINICDDRKVYRESSSHMGSEMSKRELVAKETKQSSDNSSDEQTTQGSDESEAQTTQNDTDEEQYSNEFILDTDIEETTSKIEPRKRIQQKKLPSKQDFQRILSQTGYLFKTLIRETHYIGVVEKEYLFERTIEEQPKVLNRERCQTMLFTLEEKGYVWIYNCVGKEVVARSGLLMDCISKKSLADIVKQHVSTKHLIPGIPCESEISLQFLKTRVAITPEFSNALRIFGKNQTIRQLIPSNISNSDDGTIKLVFRNSTGMKERELLLVSKSEFGQISATPEYGVICISQEPINMTAVSDFEHYCLTDDSLLVWNGTSWETICGTGFSLEESQDTNCIMDTASYRESETMDMQNVTEIPDAKQGDEDLGKASTEICLNNEAYDKDNLTRDEEIHENEETGGETLAINDDRLSQGDKTANECDMSSISGGDDLAKYGIYSHSSKDEIVSIILEKGLDPSNYDAYMAAVHALISDGTRSNDVDCPIDVIAQALILLNTLSICSEVYRDDYERLCMAVDSSIRVNHYNGTSILASFENGTGCQAHLPVCKLMTVLRALIAPEVSHDYVLNNYAESIFRSFEENFPGLGILKQLYNLALRIKQYSPTGYSLQVLKVTTDTQSEKAMIGSLVAQAHRLVAPPPAGNGFVAMPVMLSRCFGSESDLGTCIEYVSKDERENREIVQEVYFDTFCEKNEANEYVVSEAKIQAYYDNCWRIAKSTYRGVRELDDDHKRKVFSNIHERLSVIGQWLDLTDTGSEAKRSVAQLVSLKREILSTIETIRDTITTIDDPFDRTVVIAGLDSIENRLEYSIISKINEFDDFLRTGYVCMDEAGKPILDELWVKQYPLTRAVLKHIIAPVKSLQQVLHDVSDSTKTDMFDNIGQALLICRRLGIPADNYVADIATAEGGARKAIEGFLGELELSFAYGRVSENDKEDILEEMQQSIGVFFDSKYYGTMRGFLKDLRCKIETATKNRADQLIQDIERRLAQQPAQALSAVLDKAHEKIVGTEQNFAVAEEYINRFDAGITTDFGIGDMASENEFLIFISNQEYGSLYELCKKNAGMALSNFGSSYVVNFLKKQKVSVQYQESSERLLNSYPNRPDTVTEKSIKQLMTELGFEVCSVKPASTPQKGLIARHFEVEVVPDARGRTEYEHPVDIMGTNLFSPVDVICLFGKVQPNSIVSNICGMELGHTAIVILNGALSLNDRRQIAEIFHKERSGQNPFILIDWVLMLYLAKKELAKRKPIMLNCTLPFTSSFKPFVEKGSVPDEMFFGRKKELSQILDPRGPVVVYGGRQLGKTALLERASSQANKPSKREYAIMLRSTDYTPDEGVTERSLVQAIVKKLRFEGLLIPKSLITTRELYHYLITARRENGWNKILILIDEADRMIETFKNMSPSYKPLIPLNELAQETKGYFKFVLAGLHNVCRAAHDQNTIFGQFGSPLCIKPLSAADSLELLSRPLRYLGFNVDPDQLESFLVNTSFYPGIVHYVGYSLVENLMTRYSEYYQASKNNPPYQLTDKQFGEILSSGKLNEKIDERITWTLEADPRYLELACCIAYLYNNDAENNKNGHSVEMILMAADIFGISDITALKAGAVQGLLDEMVDMGILVRPTLNTYRLRQRRFLDAIGPSDEQIFQRIEEMKHNE